MTSGLRQLIRERRDERQGMADQILKKAPEQYSKAYVDFLRVHYPMLYLALTARRRKKTV